VTAGRRHHGGRRGGVPLICAGLASAVAAFLMATTWRAAPAHAATLFSFNFQSAAHGVQFFDADPANGNQEGEVPLAQASLANGPVGLGLATVAWPGPLAGNAGSLLLVLQPGCKDPLPNPGPTCPLPSQASALNYPVKAEAHSGQNPPTDTYTATPGLALTATAKADTVDSDATLQNATGDPGTFGPTHVHSNATLAGDSGSAESSTLVQNLSLVNGLIKIGSVTSNAKATTNGASSDGTATTTVTGMTINGVPASIDGSGLHIADQAVPLTGVINQTAQQLLAQAKVTMQLSAPTKQVNGPTASVQAGSLIIVWDQGGAVWSMTIGGASATVTAAPGGADALGDLGSLDTGSDSGSSLAGDTSNASSGFSTAASGGNSTGGGLGSLAAAPAAAPKAAPKAAGKATSLGNAQPISHGRPISTGSVVLALLAAALLAVGLHRLSTSVLAEPVGAGCPLAENG